MAVVINDFQMLSEPQPEPRKAEAEGAGEAAPSGKIESCALAATLRVLAMRALRSWAH